MYFHGNSGCVLACKLQENLFRVGSWQSKLYLVLGDLLCDLGCLGSHRLSWAQASLSGAQPFSQWLQRLVKLKSQNLQFLQLPLPWRQKGAMQLQHGYREMMDRWRTEADFWWLHFFWVMFLMTLKFISVYWLSFLFKKHKLKYSFLTERPSVYCGELPGTSFVK